MPIVLEATQIRKEKAHDETWQIVERHLTSRGLDGVWAKVIYAGLTRPEADRVFKRLKRPKDSKLG